MKAGMVLGMIRARVGFAGPGFLFGRLGSKVVRCFLGVGVTAPSK